MATIGEITAAVDAFMAAKKLIRGHGTAPQWGPGFSQHEIATKYPLEIEGELRGAQLMLVGFPRERNLKFQIGILFPTMVCRLDYTDETHVNSISGFIMRAVPRAVEGPHYHSWPLNRRFFRGITVPQKLHDAVPYNEPGRTFDAILRWFCADTNIDSLPPDHLISLPAPELLI